ncbi:hypothetical protein [Roseospira visakhapatnamensis]|uniref:Uncharacterized protein n=1 Tax=Roseospira visakhapatnamensis TaxID=390880 RepID=A0A7W6WC02_9PROT|nr:hypothetical protein [Roseospira visakhapatnamensis]MBB4268082.1 hypothetical protein [Roseospira visakhapatnamensis]
MFGLSLSKVLFTVAVVTIVWGAFKYYGRVLGGGGPRESLRDRVERAAQDAVRRRMGDPPGSGPESGSTSAAGRAEDLVRCPACGVWHAPDSACGCGRRS